MLNIKCPNCGWVIAGQGVGADFQHSLPPSKDVLTGGASLRDYFAAQALRSHYIISLCPPGTPQAFVAALCYGIADEFMALAIQQPTPSPDTPPATPASPPNPSIHQREVPR